MNFSFSPVDPTAIPLRFDNRTVDKQANLRIIIFRVLLTAVNNTNRMKKIAEMKVTVNSKQSNEPQLSVEYCKLHHITSHHHALPCPFFNAHFKTPSCLY